MTNLRIRSGFDRDFDLIQDEIIRMGGMVDRAIQRALEALKHGDLLMAEQVIAEDDEINRVRYQIEEDCLTLIVTQQPAARDLRAVIAAMHMTVELERMADHAAGIAKTVIRMKAEPLLKTSKKIFKMGRTSRQMLNECISAFQKQDVLWAREIAARDEEMDDLYREVFDKLVKVMGKKPDLVTRATYLMWTAHNLERIADRVTNLAERVIFMTTGDFQELNVLNMPAQEPESQEIDEPDFDT